MTRGLSRFAFGAVLASALGLAASSAFGGPPGAQGDLYVAVDNRVAQFDRETGAFVGDFVPNGSAGLVLATALVFVPGGNLLVESNLTDQILEFDGETGAYVREFANGTNSVNCMVIGPDGAVYACDGGSARVVTKYDAATGAVLDTWFGPPSLPIHGSVAFSAAGELLATSLQTTSILRFDGTGSFLGTFAQYGGPGSDVPGLVKGPDGNMLVTTPLFGVVLRLDGTTGETIHEFGRIDGGAGALAIGPEGDLYVANTYNPPFGYGVRRFDFATGVARPYVIALDDEEPYGLAFKPYAGVFPTPTVSGVSPASVPRSGAPTRVTVSGGSMQWGVEVSLQRSGENDIIGSVRAVSPGLVEVDFYLGGAALGAWDAVATYPDGHTGTLAEAFTVTSNAPFAATSLDLGGQDPCGRIVGAAVTGSGFGIGMRARLGAPGKPTIEATSVRVLSDGSLAADFDLRGAPAGSRTLTLTNRDDSEATLASALTVGSCPARHGSAFTTPATVPGGTSARMADLDGDGFLDGAWVEAFPLNVLRIARGRGDGSFFEPVTIHFGGPRHVVELPDLNGDGRPDIILGGGHSGDDPWLAVETLINNGDGTLQPAVSQSPYAGAYALACADFDSDGKVDVAVFPEPGASPNTFKMRMLHNDGTGVLSTPYAETTIPLYFAKAATAADVTGDGKADLIVGGQRNTAGAGRIVILPGNGAGGFGAAVTRDTTKTIACVTVGDIDGDGLPDIVGAEADGFAASANRVYRILNLGGGSFATAFSISTAVDEATGVVIGDVDSDSLIDIAVSNSALNTVTVFHATAPGTFATPIQVGVGARQFGLTTGDCDGNGHAELCAMVSGAGLVRLETPVQAAPKKSAMYPVGSAPGVVGVGDCDGDGDDDVVVVNQSSTPKLSPLFNDGTGVLTPGAGFGTGSSPGPMIVKDLNGDGKADVITGNTAGGGNTNLSVFSGQAGGTFSAGATVALPAGIGSPTGLSAADLDGDGDADVVASFRTFSGPSYPPSGSMAMLLNNGDGTFAAATVTTRPEFRVGPTTIADFDGDGDRDVALTSGGWSEDQGAWVTIYKNDGTGTLSEFAVVEVDVDAGSIAAGDMDGDGEIDLVVANAWPGDTVSLLFGNGNGSFQSPQELPITPIVDAESEVYVGDAILADLDADGDLDIAVGWGANIVVVLWNRGGGVFDQEDCYAVAFGASRLAAADLDENGVLDLVASGQNVNAVGVLLNETIPPCPADFNHNGTVTVGDLFAYLAAWFAQLPSADINNSGTVTVQDLFTFLAAWFEGCD